MPLDDFQIAAIKENRYKKVKRTLYLRYSAGGAGCLDDTKRLEFLLDNPDIDSPCLPSLIGSDGIMPAQTIAQASAVGPCTLEAELESLEVISGNGNGSEQEFEVFLETS